MRKVIGHLGIGVLVSSIVCFIWLLWFNQMIFVPHFSDDQVGIWSVFDFLLHGGGWQAPLIMLVIIPLLITGFIGGFCCAILEIIVKKIFPLWDKYIMEHKFFKFTYLIVNVITSSLFTTLVALGYSIYFVGLD